MAASVEELVVADPPELWTELGFQVEGDSCRLGGVRVRLDPAAGRRLAGWSLAGIASEDLDGLATTAVDASSADAGPVHPNGAYGIDHVVAFTPNLDRTVATLQAAGLDLRRIREEPTPAGSPRQAFFRLGDVVLECAQMPESPDLDPSRNAHLWGLAVLTEDLDATAAYLGDRLGEPRTAIQPGRRIATLRRAAGSTLPLAFMTPQPAPTASG